MSSRRCSFVMAFAFTCMGVAVHSDSAEVASADHFQVTALASDLFMLSTDQGTYSNNSLVFTGKDGVLLVDTHHSSDAEAFERFVMGLNLGIPRFIINTHRHVEHIGGNALFGSEPIVVAHQLFPDKLLSGTFLFNEYPPAAFPDITFEDSLEIRFNGETIRLTNIGGSHDDNEIMVHFTGHGIAHVSSVVNGFNFPSVDGDGDVMQFEPMTRRLMELLPRGTRIVSGHHGKSKGFDFVGDWEMLAAYAEMMQATVKIVRQGINEGRTTEEMQASGILDAYSEYEGSYVDAGGWIEYVADALTVPRESRADVCKPIYEVWKQSGAKAAVDHYRALLRTDAERFDFSEYVLMSIGSKLYSRGAYADAVAFLAGSLEIYPDAELSYYIHYLTARSMQKQGFSEEAIVQCRESIRLNPEFEGAANLLRELSGPS